jgi:monoamine oxidase
VVIGAGMAGLAAAGALAHAGRRVLLLDARHRAGGRVFTGRPRGWPIPVELGAEFVHGSPPELLDVVRAAGLSLQETVAREWHLRADPAADSRLVPAPAQSTAYEDFLKRLARVPLDGADRPFSSFVASELQGPELAEARARVTAYAANYHAADPEGFSLQAAALSERTELAPGSERQFRLPAGYDGVVRWLLAAAGPNALRLGQEVREVRWQRGRVEVVTRPTVGVPWEGESRAGTEEGAIEVASLTGGQVFVAPRAVVTLPLGVLRAPPGARGAVRFIPALDEKAPVLRALEMGQVTKVILYFRELFWTGHPQFGELEGRARTTHQGGAGHAPTMLGYLRAAGEPFPTWRTDGPGIPVLTAWAGGPAATRLAGRPREDVLDCALDSLARVLGGPLGLGRGQVAALLAGVAFHNWSADPFARGAYSYVGVGGLWAQRALAAPVAGTLFFAGEATDWRGHFATVDGALASGRRAAREVLAS